MDPLIGSGLITGGVSAISSLFSGIGARKRMREYLDAQAAENQKARDYNLQLAQMQNSWNIEQWNRENEYNDPAAQMARLRNAGVNPDMFYSNGASGITAASSPQMTAGAPYTPQDMSAILQKPTIGDMMSSALDNAAKVLSLRRMEKETENIEEDTKNKEKERDKIISETGKLKKDIELSDSIIRVNGTVENLNSMQTRYLSRMFEKVNWEMEQLKQSVELIKAQTQNVTVDSWQKVFNSLLNSKLVDGQLKRIAAQNALDYQELKFNQETFWDRVIQAKADTAIKWQQFKNESLTGVQLDLENQRLKFDLDVDKKVRMWKEGVGIVGSLVTSVALPIGIFKLPKIIKALKAGKATGLFDKFGKPIYRSLFDK